MIDISEITEWVIITMLVTSVIMFCLSIGALFTYIYYLCTSNKNDR